jgi:hypothetical protein
MYRKTILVRLSESDPTFSNGTIDIGVNLG